MHRLLLNALIVVALGFTARAQSEDSTFYSGRIEAVNRVDVSARIEGVITGIHFDPGQVVEAGDLLFSFNSTEFDQRLRAAEAIAQKAAALLSDVRQEYERNQILQERGTVSDSRYFKSKAAVDIAAAALAETTSRLEAAQIALKGSVMTSVYLARPMRFQILKRRSARRTLWRTDCGLQTIPGRCGRLSRSFGSRDRSAWSRRRRSGMIPAS